MLFRVRLLAPGACLAILLLPTASSPLVAQPQNMADSATLTGLVTSSDEGPMEGVLVSARQVGSTQTITVVTDRQGQYRFPRGRLAWVRAGVATTTAPISGSA